MAADMTTRCCKSANPQNHKSANTDLRIARVIFRSRVQQYQKCCSVIGRSSVQQDDPEPSLLRLVMGRRVPRLLPYKASGEHGQRLAGTPADLQELHRVLAAGGGRVLHHPEPAARPHSRSSRLFLPTDWLRLPVTPLISHPAPSMPAVATAGKEHRRASSYLSARQVFSAGSSSSGYSPRLKASRNWRTASGIRVSFFPFAKVTRTRSHCITSRPNASTRRCVAR